MRLSKFIQDASIAQWTLLNPLLLGLVPAFFVLWFNPLSFERFVFESKLQQDGVWCWFDDLDNNGHKEMFKQGVMPGAPNYLYVYDDEGHFLGQHNLQQHLLESRNALKPCAIDFCGDSDKEIVVFGQIADSLFLNVYSYSQNRYVRKKRFVTIIGGYNKHLDYHMYYLGSLDVTDDGVEELYFSISAGFALYPRRVYRYDYVQDSLLASVNTGSANLNGIIVANSSDTLIAIAGAAYANVDSSYPYAYHDSSSWLLGFTKDLEMAFEPRSYGVYPSTLRKPCCVDGVLYFTFSGNNNELAKNQLIKLNLQGDLLGSLESDTKLGSFKPLPFSDKYFISVDNGARYFIYDLDDFTVKERINRSKSIPAKVHVPVDLDDNGQQEYFFYNPSDKMMYFQARRRARFLKLNIGTGYTEGMPITHNFDKDKNSGTVSIFVKDGYASYSYYLNPLRYLRVPFYFFVYLISFVFMANIIYFQHKRILKKERLETKLADLQLQNLRAQLDPHFTFNALNSVGNAIYKEDKAVAYDLFQRFTNLIRSSLLATDKVFRSLKEELDFTTDYLEFQKTRFKDRFDYVVMLPQDTVLDDSMLPKMLIQSFAENAVKHAFYGRNEKGLITIRVLNNTEGVELHIEDDGIGVNRSRREKHTSGTQRGQMIMQKQIAQINKIYHRNISISIRDKSDFSVNNGTLVVVKLA